jgi:biopolymer transport protein ExbD
MQSGPNNSGDDSGEEGIFAEINVTPLTDVFLVLLIIFMLVASSMVEAERAVATAKGIVSERAMEIQTPKGSGESALVPKDIVISILPDGTVFLEEQQLAVSQLAPKLVELKAQNPGGARVVIRGDQKAEYQLIMEVISQARMAGLTDVALASRAR